MNELNIKFTVSEEGGLLVEAGGEEKLATYLEAITNQPERAEALLEEVERLDGELPAFLLSVVSSALISVDAMMQDESDKVVLR